MTFDFSVIWRNLDFLLLQGFLGFGNFVGGTLRLAIPSIVLGFILGIFIGLGRLSSRVWLRVPATLYVEFFRGVPLVMVIFWIWFIIPILLKTKIPEFGVALTAFVIFEAAYLAEIVRAGVQSVPRGQVEAATAVGLSGSQTMRHVVLPQALKNMIPSLVTQFIVLLQGHLAGLHHRVHGPDQGRPGGEQPRDPPLRALSLHRGGVLGLHRSLMSRYARALEKRLGPA